MSQLDPDSMRDAENHGIVGDIDRDINDDAILKAIDSDLKRARRSMDKVLMIALAATAVLVVAIERVPNVPQWISAALIVGVLLMLLGLVMAYSRSRRSVARRHGLVCSSCGHCPAAHRLMEAAMVGRCSRCKASLSLNESRQRNE
jgi:hypothetical protein